VSTPPAPGISIHVPEAILSALFAAAFVAALCWIPENAAETPALT
jgi:hypothetical protein